MREGEGGGLGKERGANRCGGGGEVQREGRRTWLRGFGEVLMRWDRSLERCKREWTCQGG